MNGPEPSPTISNKGANGTKLPEFVSSGISSVSDATSNAYTSIKNNTADASEYLQSSIDKFSSTDAVGASQSFLQSNTIVAKFAFIILVLIAFLFLANLGISLIGYFLQPAHNPYIVKGTMNGANEIVISQDPKNKSSIPVLRSNNQNSGIEFTWSIWIYINDIAPTPQYSNIFNKGNATYGPNGLATVLNGPGLYFDNCGNQLCIAMNTVSSLNPVEYLNVPNLPLQKWFHCAIRLENTVMDAYINGAIAGRLIMQDVPKQNYEDINVCKNGGFNGSIADLHYYDHALSVFEINNIVVWGRNTQPTNSSGTSDATGFPYYLSSLWYSTNY